MKREPAGTDNTFTVTVTLAELEQLRDRLGCFASMSNPDLSRWMVDATDEGDVRWTATDAYRLGRLTARTADGTPRTFGVPVRTFTLAWQMADRRDATSVTFTINGDEAATVTAMTGASCGSTASRCPSTPDSTATPTSRST